MKTLDNLPIGQSAIIKSLIPSEISAKLMEMGLLPEKEVSVSFKAPLGDPIAIKIAGYTLALRLDEAKTIELH